MSADSTLSSGSGLSAAMKAGVLIEALPWLQRFHGRIVVVKYGGNAMVDDDLKRAFAQDIAFLRSAGLHPVVVHGGGPQISAMLARMGIPTEFRGGLRVTTPEAMDVVRMVLVGQVGRELVGLVNGQGALAVGLSGEDAGLLRAERRAAVVDGEEVDVGLVGDVVGVDPSAVVDLIEAGRIPVVSSVAPDAQGQVLNVNADTAAAALAVALGAAKLVVLTDVEGLYASWPDRASVLSQVGADQLEAMLPRLESGMVPKMEACLRAVRGGVAEATVIDGRVPHSLLLEVFTPEGVGTMVLPAPSVPAPGVTPGALTTGALTPGALTTGALTPGALTPGEPSGAEWTRRYSSAVMNTFGPPKRVLVRGEGCYVWDADGRRYLDLLAGIAVNALGHAHPLLTSAVTAQLTTLGHISNFFASAPQIALAEHLLALLQAPPGSRVFFTNSGTEANEAAFKLARRTGRTGMVAAEGAFHGRTMGALALTHKPAYREPFEPLPGGVVHVPFGDAASLAAAVGPHVAAVVLEPVQGEAGVRPAPPGYLAGAREAATRAGALLVLDEVQTGVGRTGAWFAHQHLHVGGGAVPDVVTLAKGLGGGFPIGALVALGERAATLLGPGQHGTTFGGNPVAAAAALATLRVIERDGLLDNAVTVGSALRAGVEGLRHPLVAGTRGEGLLVAVQLGAPVAGAVAEALLDAGFIVNAVTPDALRLAPPLILTLEQAGTFVAALGEALDAGARVAGTPGAGAAAGGAAAGGAAAGGAAAGGAAAGGAAAGGAAAEGPA